MKKLLILSILFCSVKINYAQDLTDIYRYTSEELTGTARYISMSGAFGALGGDMAAVSLNPASSAVFLSSSANVSLGYRGMDNSLSYFNGRNSSSNSNLDLTNAGGVLIFDNTNGSDFRKLSLAINYQTTKTFDDNFVINGTGANSIDQYFLNYADGVSLDLLQLRDGESISDLYSYLGENYGFGVQQAFLGYQGYVIEAQNDDPDNTSYYSLVSPGSFDQQFAYAATGLNGKISFNVGTQFKDFLYLGLNLNSHFINYESSEEVSEISNDRNSLTNEIYFGNDLSTNGDGFSFQLGGIYKLNNLRLGFTYDSPTWYNIREDATQYIETNSANDEYVSIIPNVLNSYPEYTLRTPSKITTSFAYLFGKSGLISAEYSFKDYSKTKLTPADASFDILNSSIASNMKLAQTIKVGGEYRLAKFSMRAGYRFQESPFNNDSSGDLTGYSAGVGYDFGSISLNLAYSNAQYQNKDQVLSTGFTEPVYLDRDLSKVVLSLNFGL